MLKFEQVIIKICHFADFEQVIVQICHFADFEQAITKISHFAAFEQVKQYYQQNSFGRNRMPRHFFLRPLPCVTGTPPWLLRPMKASTSSELYPNTGLFFECLGIQFLNSSHVTYGTLCRTGDHSHSPKEAQDFPGRGNHSKHMPLPTYLA